MSFSTERRWCATGCTLLMLAFAAACTQRVAGALQPAVVVKTSPGCSERFNSGEQPNGLNLIIHDETIISLGTFGIFTGVSIRNKQSPSASDDAFLFSGTTVVLKPK